MKSTKKTFCLIPFLIIAIFASTICSQQIITDDHSNLIIHHFISLTKSSTWKVEKKIKLNFDTFHPQGMVKIGEYFYLSSVETIIKPQKFETLKNGYDRSPGKGVGHLFKFDHSGNLIAEINLGEGIIYHPGGIDFDGKYIWVPVTEYRPNSRSIIYRINSANCEVTKVFRFNDHIGAVAFNRCRNTLHGVSWGSRRFYTWKLDQLSLDMNCKNLDEYQIPEYEMKLNSNHYIDYQDCHYVADHYMLCNGLNKYTIPNVGEVAFGGMDLVDLDLCLAVHQVPLNYWIKRELVISNNPFYFELIENQLKFYFIPEDNKSKLYVFKIDLDSSE
ncbi:MAG: hypothetical protein JSW07_17615 [bacterium]|nr:MAG: hypothetical protein JSW07_17615 [bacterium]